MRGAEACAVAVSVIDALSVWLARLASASRREERERSSLIWQHSPRVMHSAGAVFWLIGIGQHGILGISCLQLCQLGDGMCCMPFICMLQCFELFSRGTVAKPCPTIATRKSAAVSAANVRPLTEDVNAKITIHTCNGVPARGL
jgi:hypothetical protein